MANITITNLPAATSLNGTEQLPAVQNGVTVRLTTADIAAYTASTFAVPSISIGNAIGGSTPGNGLYVNGSSQLGQFPYGSGVFTALQTATTSTGGPVLYNGAGGTPSSLTLTNATGLPVGGISATGTPSAANFLRGDGTWASSGLTVGLTPITGATNGYLLYNNAGLLGSVAPTAASLSIGSPITGATNGYGLYVNASTQLGQFAYGTGVYTALGLATNAASGLAVKDANSNLSANNFFETLTTITAAGTVTTLTASSAYSFVVNGSGGQTIQLPDATTLPVGTVYRFNNNQSSGTIVVRNNSATTVATLQSGSAVETTLLVNSPAAGTWDSHTLAPTNASWSTNTLSWAGSITGSTWNGVAVGILYGGTGQTTASAGFNALSPVTSTGDLIIGNGTNSSTRLAIGTNGYVLTSNGTTATWAAASAGSGTVTSVSVTTANGVSGTVATATTTPAISLTLGAITPTSVNGLTLTAAATGFTIAGGTTSKTLTVSNTLTLAGTDGSTLNVGAGGTLGSLAFLSAAPAGTLTGTTLNATVVTSSLTSVGTIGTGIWQGTVIGIGYGGTGQTTTALGTIVVGASGSTTTNLSIGSTGQVLTVSGGTAAWSAPSGVPSGTIEVGPGATYLTTAASSSAGTATVTFGGVYTIPVGATVTISGVTPSGFNGSYTVTASSAGSVSFANATAGPQTVAGSLYMTPAGYLRCDGSVYLRSSYPTLATLIGTPVKLATPTTTYTNNSLVAGTSPYQTNSVLVMSGTAGAGSSTAAATANAMLTSTDGTTWTARTSWNVAAANYYNDAVAFGASIYVAIADSNQYSSGNIPSAISSPDLVTWTKRPFTGPVAYSGVCDLCFGGTSNVFVYPINSGNGACNNAANAIAYLFYSTNGTSYTAATITAGSGIFIGCAAYASGVVVCTDQKVFYSAGGITYTDITSNVLGSATVAGIASISYANGQFILGVGTGANSSITGLYTSTTGASGSWTKVAVNSSFAPYLGSTGGSGSLPNIGKIRWNGTIYLQNIGTTAYYSTDLINWNSLTISPSSGFTAVLSSKFWGTVYNVGGYSNNSTTYTAATRYVQSIDSNAYTTATQFPTPVITIGTGSTYTYNATYVSLVLNAPLAPFNAPGGLGATAAIIKT